VEVLPSGKGNRVFWSDHGKAFVVTCSGDKGKNSKKVKLLRSQEAL
jgi:putative component of toxin-antitoxin plasmid stabilization module